MEYYFIKPKNPILQNFSFILKICEIAEDKNKKCTKLLESGPLYLKNNTR